MPGPSPTPLLINPALTAALVRVANSTTEPHARVVRARIVVLSAERRPVPEIARRTGQSVRTVRKWRARFASAPSIESLDDAHRSGRPSRVPIEARLAVIRVACERPDGEMKPKCFRDIWTQQALADEVARQTRTTLSRSEVGRILRFNMLRPHMVRQWLRSPDPNFDVKAARVCDLYLDPTNDAVVVCIDEKPMQVIARKHPTLVARDASLRREFEYVRHGTRCLLAAFDVRTGRVITEMVPHRTADALVAFVQRVADAYPGKTVYVVWDNLNTHGEGKAQRWTRFNERNGGRFHFVRTPLHASWLNQVECWFSILQRRVIRYGDFPSAATLDERVIGFATLWNEVEAHPFRWTWRSDRAEAPRRNAT